MLPNDHCIDYLQAFKKVLYAVFGPRAALVSIEQRCVPCQKLNAKVALPRILDLK